MNKLKILIQKYGLWLILLTAFLVRIAGFRWMGYTDFPEFYRDYYMVNHIAHGQIVLLGPASMLHGFHFGPFYYYSMLPFYFLFGTHPYGLIFTGIIFSVLSVYAFYKILGLWFNNHQTAIIGALFMALSVYSLHLASYTSNPNFLPLFVLWYFYELTKILEDRTFTPSRPTSTVEEWRDPLRLRSGLRLADTRPQMSRRVGSRSAEHSGSVGIAQYKDYIFLGLAFGLGTQLHATAMLILPLVTLASVLILKYKPQLKTSSIFLGIILLTYFPYLLYDFTHKFSNVKRLFILGTKELSGQHSSSGGTAIWNFFQGTLTPFNDWYSYTNIQPNILYGIVSFFALAAVVTILYRIFKKPQPLQTSFGISKIGATIVSTWTIFTVIMLLMFNRGVHDHYLIILWPVPLILLVYLVFWMKAKFSVFTSLILLVIVVSLLQIYSFWQTGHTPWSKFMPVYQTQYQNDPSVPEIGS